MKRRRAGGGEPSPPQARPARAEPGGGAVGAGGSGQAARSAAEPRPQSCWGEPHPFLENIFETLLAMEEGKKLVRTASHVCHHWRAAAQEVLLADTAISKPPFDDFRAIGVHKPAAAAPPPPPHKADTVTTQAAVVLEASASTGMEAISKQRFDAPAAAGATTRRGAGAARRAANEDAPQRLQRLPQPQMGAHRQQAAAGPAQQQQEQQQGGAVGRRKAGEQAAPQSSIHSGMALVQHGRKGASDSDSDDGSTRARGPTKRQRRVDHPRERSSGHGGSVEQPAIAEQAGQQQQALKAGAGRGKHVPPAAAAQQASPAPTRSTRKRPATSGAAEEGRRSKRQQAARQAAPATLSPPPEQQRQQGQQGQHQQRRHGTRSGLRSSGLSADASVGPQPLTEPPQSAGTAAGKGRRSGPGRRRANKSPLHKAPPQPASATRRAQQDGGEGERHAPGAGAPLVEAPSSPSTNRYHDAEGGEEVEQRPAAEAAAADAAGAPLDAPQGGGLHALVGRLMRRLMRP